jgi:hypothetical protein
MATSPLYIAPRGFAWDFSGVFSDVAQRGQIGLQLARSTASRPRASSPKSPDFDYKGEAAWWADNHSAEQQARTNMYDLLGKYGGDAQGAMNDPAFMENIQLVHQARNHPQNEFRGQQLEKKKAFESQYKDRKNELVVLNGNAVSLPDSKGEPVTVEGFTSFGTADPRGAELPWNADVTDSKGFEESLEKTFSSLKFNENKEPSISLDGVQSDIGTPMNIFLNTTYGHKSNSQQMQDALTEASMSMLQTRKNDVLAWYMRTEDYKNRKDRPVSDGGFRKGDELDQNAIQNAIFRTKNSEDDYGQPMRNTAGEIIKEPAGWFPDRLKEMAKKYGWSSNTATTSGSAKAISSTMKDWIKSQPFLDMFDGRFSSEGEGQRGYFFQGMNGSQKARTDNRSGFLLRDSEETNEVNKRLGYSRLKEGMKLRPLSDLYDGAVTAPGLFFNEDGRDVNYFKPLKNGFNAQVTEPSNRFYIGTDVTQVQDNVPIGPDTVTKKAMYHTFQKNGGMIVPVNELLSSGAKVAMPDEASIDEMIQKNPGSIGLSKQEIIDDTIYTQTRGMSGKKARKVDPTSVTRILPTDASNHSLITLEELLDDESKLAEYNKMYGTNMRVITKKELQNSGMLIDDINPETTEYLVMPDAMIRSSPVSARNLSLFPNTDAANTLAAQADSDPNKMLNFVAPQASAVDMQILQNSIR